MPKIMTQRRHRRIRLLREGFFRFELRRFTGTDNPLKSLVDYPLNRPYMLRMRRERASLLRAAKRAGWTMAKFEALIREEYRKHGWTRTGSFGRLVDDPWSMFRYYYRQSVRLGEYDEPPQRKRDKGDVKGQKVRYRDRQARRVVRNKEGKKVGRVVLDQTTGIWSVQYV